MGTAVFATCRMCGYRDSLHLGASRATHLERADWPVWCDDCGKMATTNYKQRPLRCRHCHSENVTRPEAAQNTRINREPVITWMCRIPELDETKPVVKKSFFGLFQSTVAPKKYREQLGLHNGLYRCPDCNEHQMCFSEYMQFD